MPLLWKVPSHDTYPVRYRSPLLTNAVYSCAGCHILHRLEMPNPLQYERAICYSGSAFDLAEIVESLTELSETKKLSFGEHKTLDRAKALLVSEISEVIGETKEKAERQVDMALKARKEEWGVVL